MIRLLFIALIITQGLYSQQNDWHYIDKKIDVLDIENLDSCYQANDIFCTKEWTLLVLLDSGCTACNKNRDVWNKLAIHKIPIYGITFSKSKLAEYNQPDFMSFKTFYPVKLGENIKTILQNPPVTVICYGNKITAYKRGRLGINDYLMIKKKVRR